jgi:hypothetical protein
MKYIFDFLSFNEEINPKDIFFIQSNFDNYFTIAYEFEVETDDTENYQYDFEEIDEDVLDDTFKDVKKELNLTRRSDITFLKNLLDSILEFAQPSSITTDSKFNRLGIKLFLSNIFIS